jgi:serine/threonine protein kinase
VASQRAAVIDRGDGDLSGHDISHYHVLRRLGGGGMGVVYEAEDARFGRRVALKFLPPGLVRDTHAVEPFQREAREASALNHPTSARSTTSGKTRGSISS